jgi:hypothetical protein
VRMFSPTQQILKEPTDSLPYWRRQRQISKHKPYMSSRFTQFAELTSQRSALHT